MRCIACNRNLSDFESTRKSKTTGEYLDMCNKCYSTVKASVPVVESEQFPEEDEIEVEPHCPDYSMYDDEGNYVDD